MPGVRFRTVAIRYLHRVLLVESLLVLLLDWRLNVLDRHGLLRARLVHRDGVGPVLVECRLLR